MTHLLPGRIDGALPATGLLGALVLTATNLLQALDPTYPGGPGSGVRAGVGALAALMTVALPLVLARALAPDGAGVVVRAGTTSAALGWITYAAALTASWVRGIDIVPLHIVASALVFFGVVPAAALAARAWRGWRRWTPLATLVVFAAASPFFDAAGAASYLASTAWALTWTLLGSALVSFEQSSARPRTTAR